MPVYTPGDVLSTLTRARHFLSIKDASDNFADALVDAGVLPKFGFRDALLINTLGDSISAVNIMAPTFPSTIKQWVQNEVVPPRSLRQNGGFVFGTTAGGTSASSGSGPTRSSLTDGTITWINRNRLTSVGHTSYLHWVETLSNGQLIWDPNTGYTGPQDGAAKAIIVNGGTGYTNPTLTNTDGIEATFTVENGVIRAINITSPGIVANVLVPPTITDATGTGAVVSWVFAPSGTFSVSGSLTQGMVYRAPDAAASAADIIVVLGGTNDIVNSIPAATIINNLRTCYEILMNAGKRVVAVPVLPRTGLTTAQSRVLARVNQFIRAYCARKAWANPSGFDDIALADPAVYLTDGATDDQPIGGAANVVGAMTYDGLHPSGRGAFYIGECVRRACLRWTAPPLPVVGRQASSFDAYDAVLNPTGNLLEGFPWAASTAYVVGDLVRNDSPARVYVCTAAGTSAGSGGPTGTGASITDGGVTWAHAHLSGQSVFRSGTGGTLNAAAGVTITGNLAGGFLVQRNAGTAAGSLTAAIESPWSNGQPGQRQSLVWSLGSGSATETWVLQTTSLPVTRYGLTAADLGVTPVEFAVEFEVSNVLNVNGLRLQLYVDYASSPPNDYIAAQAGSLFQTTGLNATLPNSASEMIAYPNNGLMTLRTKPVLLPEDMITANANLLLWFFIEFNASGGAASSTLTLKVNNVSLRKAL